MHRFYVPPELCSGNIILLSEDEAHHATRVLRIETGESVVVLDGAGHTFDCEVRDVTKRSVTLSVKQKTFTPPLPCQITLLQAIPKAKAMDYIVQKATELGAARIVPILSERVVVQLNEREAVDKAEKLRPVALEAIKQCGSPWLTKIDPPVSLKNFLARGEQFELPLVASLHEGRLHPREHIRRFQQQSHRLPSSACVWIGPEGDFTPAEMELLHQHAQPISLGKLVLRSDTAAIYSLSVLNHELQPAT
ncbi:MAG: RsmE family RNA methyltransferase [Verrucomicrobiota bacterium]